MMQPTTAKYRHRLPQLGQGIFLTDGGLETTLVFHQDWELPFFESFTLLESDVGQATLRAYFRHYIEMAIEHGVGFILESPTWRASPDWGVKIGRSRADLAKVNKAGVGLMHEIRGAYETPHTPLVISGCIGPRGDGYDPGTLMTADEAEAYHAWQIAILRDAGVDLLSAFTMTNINEAIGVARAAKAAGIPSVISFTLETDGRLPTSDTLAEAIEAVDRATAKGPAYYMINCAHPTHFDAVLEPRAPWVARLRGLRANSSHLSHAELDNAPELDMGNPSELGEQYAELLRRLPHINVLGGCCGTDHRHVACIAKACLGNTPTQKPADAAA